MSNDIETRLAGCFSAIFPDIPADTFGTLVASNSPEWDSLATVNLAGVIEEEFDVDIGPEQAKQFTSFASIAAFLTEQTG